MTFKYKYECPSKQGYTKFNVTRKQHNALLKNYKTNWYNAYTYWWRSDAILIQRTTSNLGKAVNLTLFPFVVILHGLVNFKEVWKEYKQMCDELQTGSFVSDVYWHSRYPKTHEEFSKLKFKR